MKFSGREKHKKEEMKGGTRRQASATVPVKMPAEVRCSSMTLLASRCMSLHETPGFSYCTCEDAS
jgi:hypothetical protein